MKGWGLSTSSLQSLQRLLVVRELSVYCTNAQVQAGVDCSQQLQLWIKLRPSQHVNWVEGWGEVVTVPSFLTAPIVLSYSHLRLVSNPISRNPFQTLDLPSTRLIVA